VLPRGEATSGDLIVRNGGVSLAGTLWLPAAGSPAAIVLMHPGSGPSDRDNDVYFPPIREHLLASGFGVCSFDKRGVGGSTGRWEEAAIVEQADDALAAVEALLADEDLDTPVGLFGHSQGGWVVIEAAGHGAPVAFVVTNSGPGVTPGEQERYAARAHLARAGATPDEIREGMQRLDLVLALMRDRVPLDDVRSRFEAAGIAEVGYDLPLVPDDPAIWNLAAALIHYDPRPALERIRVPVLALFGADDPIVPVAESVAVYREAVRPDLLTIAVFPGGDHRSLTGDPPRLVDGYLETLVSFLSAAVPRPSQWSDTQSV
jgi:pimeloyl-ACP methyl ester carboxylesterase